MLIIVLCCNIMVILDRKLSQWSHTSDRILSANILTAIVGEFKCWVNNTMFPDHQRKIQLVKFQQHFTNRITYMTTGSPNSL